LLLAADALVSETDTEVEVLVAGIGAEVLVSGIEFEQ
jgi:hypothetical protein